MSSNATYVFIDLGTTNDPTDNNIKIITEISMAAVSKDNLLDAGLWYEHEDINGPANTPVVPRVQLKLTLCFHPGLEELLNGGFKIRELKHEKNFDECFGLIDSFLNILPDPVYLVAHNGFNFDFPILKRHLKGKKFSKFVMCADTFYGFYDILENNLEVQVDELAQTLTNLNVNELRKANAERIRETKGFPWGGKANRPNSSYKLMAIYERVFKCKPEDSHKGDIDCQQMIRIAVKLSRKFVDWVEKNHSSFEEHVEPILQGINRDDGICLQEKCENEDSGSSSTKKQILS